MSTSSRVAELIPAERAVEGEGFVVRRPFPTMGRPQVDPFLLFDHLGPVTNAPGAAVGTSWHPHRGFETVTYLLEGDVEHLDSLGNHGRLGPGDTQWMTAGSGVLHKEGPSEETRRRGGTMHGLQLWVNLPSGRKMIDPAYQDIRADEVARSVTDGATIRVIAGTLFGLTGPGSTHTPISYAHITLAEGATVSTELPEGQTAMLYPLVGDVSVGDTLVAESHLAVLDAGRHLEIVSAGPVPAEVIVLTGEPIGEPIARMGPFVMNNQAEIRQAMIDYQDGKFGVPLD